MTDHDDPDRPTHASRVAVIVVSGVGDDARGAGRDALVATLAGDPQGRWEPSVRSGEITLVASADTGSDAPAGDVLRTGTGSPNLREPFIVPAATMAGLGGAPDVEIHEMHWADLSRAQGPAQRLFYLLFAITLTIGTLGLEAVRRFPRDVDPDGAPGRRRLAWALTVMSYWQAYVITPLVVAMLALAVTVNLELLSGAGKFTGWVLFAVIGAGAAMAASWVGERIYRGGWTFDRTDAPWAYTAGRANPWMFRAVVALVVVASGAAVWFGADEQHRVFSLQLAGLAAIAAVTTAIAASAADVAADAATAGQRAARRRARLAIRTAVAAVPLGAMALALYTRDGGDRAAVRAADALTAVTLGAFRAAWLVMLLLAAACAILATVVRFRVRPAVPENQRLSASVLMTVMLGPVLYALATSAAFLVFAALWRIYPDSAKRWAPGELPRLPGSSIAAPLGDRSSNTSTIAWGYDLVHATIQPLGLALILAGIVLGFIAAFFSTYVRSFRQRNRYANAADVSAEQGHAFSAGVRKAGSDPMFLWAYTPMIVLIAAAAIVFWTIPATATSNGEKTTWNGVGRYGAYLADIATPLAYLIAVLAVAGVGLKSAGAAGRFGGGFLAGLGRVLDFVYDVSSYLRVANPAIVAPRIRMIARFRALLSHVAAEKPVHIVIMAHSQGTILSLATLLGDPDRSPPLGPLPAADRPDAPITFLSYGTPVTQSYAARFPGQFAQWTTRPDGGTAIAHWLNVFRAGDFIGRSVAVEPNFDPNVETTHANGTERCLGPGQHTAYLADERWRRVARHVVTSAPDTGLSGVSLDDLTVASRDEPVRA